MTSTSAFSICPVLTSAANSSRHKRATRRRTKSISSPRRRARLSSLKDLENTATSSKPTKNLVEPVQSPPSLSSNEHELSLANDKLRPVTHLVINQAKTVETSLLPSFENERNLESERLRRLGKEASNGGQPHTALQLFQQSVEIGPHNGRAWQTLAKHVGSTSGYRRATKILIRALRLNRGNAYLWQSLALLLTRMHRVSTARRLFAAGVRADPSHTPLYTSWAELESEHLRVSEARALYKRGESVGRPSARHYMAWARFESRCGGNHQRAIKLLQRGIQYAPDNPYLWNALGDTHRTCGAIEAARRCYLSALNAYPNCAPALDALARLEAAAGNPHCARTLFRRGHVAAPADARLLHGWSVLELRANRPALARTLIQRAVTLSSNDSFLWTHYARVEERLRNIPAARALYKRAVSVGADDWRAFDLWATLEHREGNKKLADSLLHRSFAIRFGADGKFIVLANSLEDRPDDID